MKEYYLPLLIITEPVTLYIRPRIIVSDLRFASCYEVFVGVFGSSCGVASLRIAPNADCAGFALLRPIPHPAPRPITRATRPMSMVAHKGIPPLLFVVVVVLLVIAGVGVAETTGFTVKTKAP